MKQSNNPKELLPYMKETDKVVFGTKSNQYHIIDQSDRDYNTIWSFNKEQVMMLTKQDMDHISNLPLTFV